MAGLRFTAEEWAAALEPPAFAVGARTYTGRVLSVEEWAPFADASPRAERGELSNAETAALVRRLVETMFPPERVPPPRRRLLGWRRRPPPDPVTPADVFCALPWPVQLVYLQSFSRCQAQLLTPMTKPTASTTRSAGPPPPGASDSGGSSSAGATPRNATRTTGRSSSRS